MKQSFLDLLEIEDFSPISHQSIIQFDTYGVISSIDNSKIGNSFFIWNPNDIANLPIKVHLENLSDFSLFPG